MQRKAPAIRRQGRASRCSASRVRRSPCRLGSWSVVLARRRPDHHGARHALTVGVDSYCDYSTLRAASSTSATAPSSMPPTRPPSRAAARIAVLTMETMVEWRGASPTPIRSCSGPGSARTPPASPSGARPPRSSIAEVLLDRRRRSRAPLPHRRLGPSGSPRSSR